MRKKSVKILTKKELRQRYFNSDLAATPIAKLTQKVINSGHSIAKIEYDPIYVIDISAAKKLITTRLKPDFTAEIYAFTDLSELEQNILYCAFKPVKKSKV